MLDFKNTCSKTVMIYIVKFSNVSCQQVKMAVRRIFCSYLNLLINSKNDLALALTLDVPCRTLGRQAFTDIKHKARDTSLFLVRGTDDRQIFRIKYIFIKFIHLFAGSHVFREGHSARRKRLRSRRVWPPEETHQGTVWLCPLPWQPRGNSGGDPGPKVYKSILSPSNLKYFFYIVGTCKMSPFGQNTARQCPQKYSYTRQPHTQDTIPAVCNR